MLKIKFTDNEETRRHNNAVSYCFCLCTMGETGHGIMRKNEGCPMLHRLRFDRLQMELQANQNVQTASADRVA